MKRNTLEKMYLCMKYEQPEIIMDEELAPRREEIAGPDDGDQPAGGTVVREDVRMCGFADVRICGYADVRMCGYADVQMCRWTAGSRKEAKQV
jgi:hypothetical protein